MRRGLLFLLLAYAGLGCYATSSTPPGPNCIQDPNNPACFPLLTDDQKSPDAGVR